MRKHKENHSRVGGVICDKTDFMLISIHFSFDFLSLENVYFENSRQ